MALVDYDSSSSEDGEQSLTSQSQSPKRQKKLPVLPSTFDLALKDDLSLHQGRTRSRPFVEGEYNTHLYLSLTIPDALLAVLKDVIASLPPFTHPIHPLLPKLHISLTRPLPLRRHQIQSFRDKLSEKLSRCGAFRLSLAGRVKAYSNEIHEGVQGLAKGRGFLALRVGAGASELKAIQDKVIHPILDVVHLPTYYENPEFHSSFAWSLLESRGGKQETEADLIDSCSVFSNSVLEGINEKFEERILAAQPSRGWSVDSVELKISKEVTRLFLGCNNGT
ncbi:hypothetical protein L204_100848 [Cryptococcus depauperatus]|nr:hypothetical protein L204_01219 [Cryptococcus depauperatus CBS 7855]